MSGWDDPISVVEDLDPEPEQQLGRFQLRDLVLGLLLLVGVIGFAGWQWWSHEARQSRYTRAAEALSRNELDDARALFAGASGYRDADSRVRYVEQRIALRDSVYMSATTHIASKEWPAALVDLRALRDVQPGYRASSHLERIVVVEIGFEVTEGSVALREPPDGPAGLYYRRDREWLYLPGSDAASRVLGSGAVGLLVYDVPAGGEAAGVRRVMLGNFLGSAPVSTSLRFDPTVYSDFKWNEKGVWAFRHGRYSTPGRPPIVRAMHGTEAAYMAYGSDAIYPISFENSGGAMGEVLVDVDPTSDHYLMASWTGAARLSSEVLSNTIVSLSVGSAGGGNHMVYATRGVGLESASLSRDGRFVLVTTYTSSASGDVYRLLLIDTRLGGEPQQIDGVRARDFTGSGIALNWMTSTFIETGAYAGKVLTAVFNYDHTHLRLYDPELPEEPMLDVEVPTSGGLMWSIARSDGGGLVVSGALPVYSPPYGREDTQTVPVVEISPRGHVTQTGVLVDRYSYPYGVDLVPDNLAVVSVMSAEDTHIWVVYSAPAAGLGQPSVRPAVLYTQYVPGSSGLTEPGPVNVGGGLLTYLEDETLRVRTYDGAIDSVLDEGIIDFFPRRYLHDRYPMLR
jgi:hypothetical protein